MLKMCIIMGYTTTLLDTDMTPDQHATATHALYTALDAYEYQGKSGQSALAAALTDKKGIVISRALVNSWLTTNVPIGYLLAVESLLGVDRRVIRPDLIDIFGDKH